MNAALPLVIAMFTAVTLTGALTPLLRRAKVIDIPVERSLHHQPVPRGGGVAVIAALALTVLVGYPLTSGDTLTAGTAWLVVSILGFASLGFADDLRGLSPVLRLGVQIMLGVASGVVGSLIYDQHLIWALLAMAFLGVLVNITNFMDGANGLVTVHAMVAGLWYAAVAAHSGSTLLTVSSMALAGAALGFAPFNVIRARIFLGDAGSYGIGAALGLTAVALLASGAPLAAISAPLLIYFLDTAYTLQLRLRAGHRWYEPHRLHVYQRLISAGWSHLRVTALVAATAAVTCLLTLPALAGAHPAGQAVSILAIGTIGLCYVRLPVWFRAPEPWRPGSTR